jgi:hypothetical protein
MNIKGLKLIQPLNHVFFYAFIMPARRYPHREMMRALKVWGHSNME